MKPITVVLAEDHLIVREGLRALLASDDGIEIIGESADGRHAVTMVSQLSPDVVVMDIAMPSLNGMEAARQILKAQPSCKVLFLSAHSDDVYVDHAAEIGCSGFLVKQSVIGQLQQAIRQVYEGKTYFSPHVAKRIARLQKNLRFHETPAKGLTKGLTKREMEVLQLIAEGKANKQTADDLSISIKTVEKHRQRIMEKLNIHETAGLTRYAIATGIIENPLKSTTL